MTLDITSLGIQRVEIECDAAAWRYVKARIDQIDQITSPKTDF